MDVDLSTVEENVPDCRCLIALRRHTHDLTTWAIKGALEFRTHKRACNAYFPSFMDVA
jgi:hypothetical protein